MRTVGWAAGAEIAVAIGVLTAGCGGEAGRSGEHAVGPSEDTTLVSSLGWSVRDSTPYARTEHSGVLDTRRDRLLLLGGVANDLWQLPLSGEHANQWRQLAADGERPPGGHAEVVYDERDDQVLALFTRYEGGASTGELWRLSLGDAPAWQRVVPEGADPGAELLSGRIVIHDGSLLALGKGGAWSLDLRSLVWTRLGDAPELQFGGPLFGGWGGEAFLLDAPRARLVAMFLGGDPWEMPLKSGVWARLGPRPSMWLTAPGVLDAASERLIFPDHVTQVFALATNQWQARATEDFQIQTSLSSATVDAKRKRAVYVSGSGSSTFEALSAYRGGDTWQLSLDSFEGQVLVPNARGAIHCARSAWDPTRQAVVSPRAEGYSPGPTLARKLGPRAIWEDLRVGDAPLGLGATLVYDSVAGAVFGFGGLADSQQPTNALARLSSEAGARWQQLTAAGGPSPRSDALVVYDSELRQLVVRGGGASGTLADVWTFSTATETWSQLEPRGEGPGPRVGEAGVYDPVGRRLIVWGGELFEERFEDVHALSLDEAPTWTALNPAGELPVLGFGERYALYDPQGKRMIAMVRDGRAIFVYALSLDDSPTWHRFCSVGVSPDPFAPHGEPLLTDDGIFLAVANGAFKFDLRTPYCD